MGQAEGEQSLGFGSGVVGHRRDEVRQASAMRHIQFRTMRRFIEESSFRLLYSFPFVIRRDRGDPRSLMDTHRFPEKDQGRVMGGSAGGELERIIRSNGKWSPASLAGPHDGGAMGASAGPIGIGPGAGSRGARRVPQEGMRGRRGTAGGDRSPFAGTGRRTRFTWYEPIAAARILRGEPCTPAGCACRWDPASAPGNCCGT